MSLLDIRNLEVSVLDKKILDKLNLKINKNETHVIMGPNGSGKSTICYSIMNHPKYKITSGDIIFNNKKITNLPTNEISKKGIYLSFQNPLEIPGLNFLTFLKNSYENINNVKISIFEFKELIKKKLKELNINESFLNRDLNIGFSGGEKKRAEILLLSLLNPKLIILDELDSGLDVDSLKMVSQMINKIKSKNKGVSIIIITHYNHILKYIKPDFIHIIYEGKIIKDGKKSLIYDIEKNGFKKLIKNYKKNNI